MKNKFIKYCLIFLIFINISHAKTLNTTDHHPSHLLAPSPKSALQYLLTGILSFFAAAISSAGGLGGGGLFIPILTIIAGLDLKTASGYSAFMVTGGSVANVAGQIFFAKHRGGGRPLIDYDIALLSEPCMLLGVSIGVICNVMFPEWLIANVFAIFLALCTFKTYKSGVLLWRRESEGERRNVSLKIMENGIEETTLGGEGKLEMPWKKLGMLVVIWFSFFLLYLLRGNRYRQVN